MTGWRARLPPCLSSPFSRAPGQDCVDRAPGGATFPPRRLFLASRSSARASAPAQMAAWRRSGVGAALALLALAVPLWERGRCWGLGPGPGDEDESLDPRPGPLGAPHRHRRSWVWNQFFVLEEYTGNEPLYVGKVSPARPIRVTLSVAPPPWQGLPRDWSIWPKRREGRLQAGKERESSAAANRLITESVILAFIGAVGTSGRIAARVPGRAAAVFFPHVWLRTRSSCVSITSRRNDPGIWDAFPLPPYIEPPLEAGEDGDGVPAPKRVSFSFPGQRPALTGSFAS